MISPYEELANAIILQAVKDYRHHLKLLHLNPGNKTALRECRSLERFFRSAWYRVLTDVDGEYLIRKLREEIMQ